MSTKLSLNSKTSVTFTYVHKCSTLRVSCVSCIVFATHFVTCMLTADAFIQSNLVQLSVLFFISICISVDLGTALVTGTNSYIWGISSSDEIGWSMRKKVRQDFIFISVTGCLKNKRVWLCLVYEFVCFLSGAGF